MKHLFKLMAAFTLLLIVYSCQPKAEPCPPADSPHPNGVFAVSSTDTISLDTFTVRKARWDANYLSYMATRPIEYFSTPLLDYTTILSDPSYTGSRQYMGMSINSRGELSPHLMTIGTKTVGGVPHQPDFSLIMDYAAACPTTCY